MKYKVLKEFVSPFGGYYKVGDFFPIKELDFNKEFRKALLGNGFIEEIKDEPWKPNYGDEYWYMDEEGEIFWEDKFNRNSVHDEDRLNLGNCFQTEKQAEKAVAWLKAFKVLRDDTKGFKPDWSDDRQTKWAVRYNAEHDILQTSVGVVFVDTILYFATEADAEESIKNHRQEWLTFFGVESE